MIHTSADAEEEVVAKEKLKKRCAFFASGSELRATVDNFDFLIFTSSYGVCSLMSKKHSFISSVRRFKITCFVPIKRQQKHCQSYDRI